MKKLKIMFAVFLILAVAVIAASCDNGMTETNNDKKDNTPKIEDDVSDAKENSGVTEEDITQNDNKASEDIPAKVSPIAEERITRLVKSQFDVAEDAAVENVYIIPTLLSDTEAATAFNANIRAAYPELAFADVSDGEVTVSDHVDNYGYIFDITDNGIAAIVITKASGFFYSEMTFAAQAFYFDTVNDREATAEEYLASIGTDFGTVWENAEKYAYIETAMGRGESYSADGIFTYYLSETVIRRPDADPDTVGIFTDYGFYTGAFFEDVPVTVFEPDTASAKYDTYIYDTPSPAAKVNSTVVGGEKIRVYCTVEPPEYETIEYDDTFTWYAVEYGGIHGYMIADELKY